MEKATYKYVFNRNSRLDNEGKGLIHLMIYFSRTNCKYVSTNITILPEYWNKSENRVNSKHPNYILINRQLELFHNKVEEIELRCLNEDIVFTIELLKKHLSGDVNINLNDFIKSFLEASGTTFKKGTKTNHNQMLGYLNEFKSEISFKNIDYNLVKDFDLFLHSKKLSTNTIDKHHRNLKKYINESIKSGYCKSVNPYTIFKSKKEVVKRENLTDREVQRIIDLQYETGIDNVRNAFIFSVATGLRFSDILTLQKKHITETNKGFVIDKKMYKTSVYVNIPVYLMPLFGIYTNKLLAGYLINKTADDYVFDFMTNNKEITDDNIDNIISSQNAIANKALKTIQVDADIDTLLHFHLARHTCGTNLAKKTGNVFKVMKYLGIRKVDTAMIYIHLAEDSEPDEL